MKGTSPKYVIALGASAGGLEALQDFLSNLPKLENVCIIVAQHVSPTHKSLLAGLLARETNLAVIEAESGMKLEVGNVYITPPDSSIRVEKKRIVLEKPKSDKGPKPSVNLLFSSLGSQKDFQVIGIILSGTGSDGATGVKELKQSGAYIITQDPGTAKYDGMPNAAIHTGLVDAVLSPDKMGEELVRYLSGPNSDYSLESSKINDEHLEAIFELMGKRTGTDFSEYKSTTIGRRLQKRLTALHLDNLEAYLKVLKSNPAEIDEMFKTILIGVTTFFRDEEPFEAIKELLHKIVASKLEKQPIRIWSAGCSSGEEAYSIAILLWQILGERVYEYPVQIFATDIDERAIAIARKGIYPETSLVNLSPEMLEEFFIQQEEGFEIKKALRKMVVFSKHDVIRNPPYLKLDLIICRNLLIYFNSLLQQKVLPIFHYALQSQGYLFLGKSETVGGLGDLFTVVDSRNKLYQRVRGVHSYSVRSLSLMSQNQKRLESVVPTGKGRKTSLADMVKETLFKTYEHPYVVVNALHNILEVNGDVRLFMSLTQGGIQVNLIKMLNPELQMDVRTILNKSINGRISAKSHIKSFNLYGQEYYVQITAKPLLYEEAGEELYVVVFELVDMGRFASSGNKHEGGLSNDTRIAELEKELLDTKEQLQTYIEEIETSNEELVSLNEELQVTNEELQSTNEELETTNEELESAGEEIQIAYNELRLAHEELEAKEELLKRYQADTLALLNNDLQAFVLIDPTFRILQFNNRAKETFNVLSGKLIKEGDSVIHLFSSANVESFLKDITIATDIGQFKAEKRLKSSDGSERWYSLNYSSVKFDGSNISSISMSLLDITDLKMALSELNATEKLVNSVFNAVPVGMCITDNLGIFVDVNETYCKIYGYSREELIGKAYSMVWPERDRKAIQKQHDDFIEGQEEDAAEYDVEKRNGQHILIEVKSRRLIQVDGSKFKVTSVKDITSSRASQQQLSALTNNLPGVILKYKLRPDGSDELLYLSDGAKLLWGLEASECMEDSNKVWSLFHPDDLPQVRESIQESADTMTNWSIEWRIIHPDGRVTWQRGRGNPSKAQDGSVVWDSLILDITDEKEAQEEAGRYDKELRKILDSSLDVICTVDVEGNFERVSKAAETNWGYKREELIGKPYIEFVHEDDIDKTNLVAEEIMSGVAQTNFENTYRRKDGSYVPMIWSARWDPSDQKMYCVARDATERKLAEEQLKISELRFKTLLENGLDAIVVLGPDGVPTYVSPTTEKVLGYSEEEALSLNLFELLHPEDVAGVLAKMEEVLKAPGVPIEGYTARTRHKDGSWRWLEAVNTNLLHDPIINGIVDNFRDVTSRVEAEQELKASEMKYRNLFNLSPLPKLIFDITDFTIVDVNRTAINKYEYEPDEFLNLSVLEIGFTKAQLSKISKTIPESGDENNIDFGIQHHKTKSGKTIEMEVTGHQLEVNDRNCLMVVCNDVTEREKAFTNLQKSEARFRGLYESETSYVLRIDMEGNYTYYNRKYKEDFGWIYNEDELLGINSLVAILDRDHQKTLEAVEKCIESPGKVFKVEIDKPSRNSEYVSTLWDFVCIADELGLPKEIQCVGIDISDRIKFERQLLQSNERYRLVNMATNDAIYDWDVEEDVFDWGDGYYRNFGYEKTDEVFRLKDWIGKMHPIDREKNAGHWNDFLKDTSSSHWNKEFRWKKEDGSFAYVEEIGYLIRDNNGRPKRMIGVLRDTSVAKQEEIQKALERQLSNLFKMEAPVLEIFSSVLEHLVDFAECKIAELWLISYDQKYLNLVSSYDNGKVAETFYKFAKDTRHLKKGEGAPGLVWESDDIVVLNQIQTNELFVRNKSAKNAELETAIGIPLYHNNDIVGVLLVCNKQEALVEESRVNVLKNLKYFLGAEIKRKLQEEELHLFFHSAPDILAIAAPGGYFLKVNPAFSQLLGYSEEELTSQPFENFLHPEDKGSTKIEYQETISGIRKARNFVNRYRTIDGNYKWISWSSSNIYGEDGLAFAYGRDITERKKTELEIKRAFEEKNNILESIGDGFFTVDKNWIVTYWNHKAEEILRVKKEDILGVNIWEVFNTSAAQEFFDYYNKAMDSGESVVFEKFYSELNIWLEIAVYPSEKGLSVYFKDTSIRRNAEESIRLSNERFEKVSQATNDAIWDWDIIKNELYWGGGFKTLFGYNSEHETPSLESWVSHIHQDDVSKVMESIHKALNDPYTTNWVEEYRYQKQDGSHADVIDRGIIIRDGSGSAIRMLGAMTDITYRKEYQVSLERLNQELAKHTKELEISNAELEQFAYVASHDLQEPLRMVSSFLTQLEKKYKDQLDDKANQYIHFAVDGAKRMRQTILDLLQYSRVGRFEDTVETIDLNEIIEDYRVLRLRIIEEKSAQVKTTEPLPIINTFKTPVTQIFHNLIDNALKYSKEDTPPIVTINHLDKGDHWEFIIEDNGIGIEEDYYDKIFVIFQRLHDKEKYSGTGMGLAIVKKILESLGGKIWLISVVGQGTAFHFTIPK